ncbi:MAG: hypothetical protein R2730_04130 [Chitinophagales bacterium]
MVHLSLFAKEILTHLNVYLNELSDKDYEAPLPLLSDASIGAHTRHALDGFLCLMRQHDSGLICYDRRERDRRIESDVFYAKQTIEEIGVFLDSLQKNAPYQLEINYNEYRIITHSSVEREIIHNIEHVIHHLAIIKIALLHYHSEINIPEYFGVAPSTLQYRESVEVSLKD